MMFLPAVTQTLQLKQCRVRGVLAALPADPLPPQPPAAIPHLTHGSASSSDVMANLSLDLKVQS